MDRSGFGVSRRALFTGLAAAFAVSLSSPRQAQAESEEAAIARTRAALADAKGTKLVLLGTSAGPVPGQPRNMTSHLLVHNGAAYIVDCGLGVTRQFALTGTSFRAVRGIFITHHHPDHNIEYGPFLVIGWVRGLQQKVRAYGPPPLEQMTQDFLRSAKATIDFWAEDLHRPPLGPIEAHDLPTAGPVMQDEIVKVTSALVEHPPVKPAYGYRFDFPDRSIAFSGDTVAVPSIVALAKGTDVLVHETIDMRAIEALLRRELARGVPGNLETFMAHMRADHTPTEEVGRIAQEAGVKTLVLSHLSPGDGSVSDQAWRRAAGKHFKGRIIVGRDLMVI